MAKKLDSYARKTFEFIDTVNQLTTAECVVSALNTELASYGFDYVTIWSVPPPGYKPAEPLLNTRPAEYVERYIAKNYVVRDPVVRHLRSTLSTFSWSDVRNTRPLSKDESQIVGEAREFGVYDGLIIPIITATGQLSIVSPCGRAPDLSPRARSAVTMVGVFGQQALRRMHLRALSPNISHQPLTKREREILQLVAYGKTDAEIAQILNLRPSTVLAHVENAKRKLGTTKRPLAVITALRTGEISF